MCRFGDYELPSITSISATGCAYISHTPLPEPRRARQFSNRLSPKLCMCSSESKDIIYGQFSAVPRHLSTAKKCPLFFYKPSVNLQTVGNTDAQKMFWNSGFSSGYLLLAETRPLNTCAFYCETPHPLSQLSNPRTFMSSREQLGI